MKKGVPFLCSVFALILVMSASSSLALNHSGSITTDETWYAADNPHVITSSTTVSNDAILTIQPGVEIRFDGPAVNGLIIGEDGGTGGKLIARGTLFEKILFTSNATTPQPGDWTSIAFSHNASDGSVMEHVIIEYGGGGSGASGNLDIYSTNPRITNCKIRRSSGYGVDVSSSSPRISCCDILDNSIGVRVDGSSSPVISNNNILGNADYGVYNSSTTHTVQATDNWWGDFFGPGGEGPGAGDAVSAYVDYDPWRYQFRRIESTVAGNCTDGIDNDCDGLVDTDPECMGGTCAGSAEASTHKAIPVIGSSDLAGHLACFLLPVGVVITLRILRKKR